MNSFWTGFGVGSLIIIILYFVSKPAYQKFVEKKEPKNFRLVIPFLCMGIALIILFLNIDAILKPEPIGTSNTLNYVLTNKAVLHMLIYVGTLSLLAVIWMISTFPFSFDGLKKFSGFGVTAEFNEKVQEVVESRSIINEISSIRENTLKIITSEQYYIETLSSMIVEDNQGFSIDTNRLVDAALETIQTSFESSESKISVKYNYELVEKDNEDKAKERLSEFQKEMSEACLTVIRKNKPYIWKGTLALKVTPFNIEEEENSYFVLCIHTENLEFNNKDIDFIYTVINVMEKLVDLIWYKNEVLESDESGQVV
jgi:hypothetical protein